MQLYEETIKNYTDKKCRESYDRQVITMVDGVVLASVMLVVLVTFHSTAIG